MPLGSAFSPDHKLPEHEGDFDGGVQGQGSDSDRGSHMFAFLSEDFQGQFAGPIDDLWLLGKAGTTLHIASDLQQAFQVVDPTGDLDFDYLGIQTLYDRYLIIDKTKRPHQRLETPQLFWMPVAMGLFVPDKKNPEEKIIALYNLYKGRRFCSSAPAWEVTWRRRQPKP